MNDSDFMLERKTEIICFEICGPLWRAIVSYGKGPGLVLNRYCNLKTTCYKCENKSDMIGEEGSHRNFSIKTKISRSK
jgi:hypothetical protein